MNRKVLLVLTGESFRYDYGRTRGCEDCRERQYIASRSHVELCNNIKNNHNYDVDLFINTYKLNDVDDEILINYYKNLTNVVKYNFHETCFDCEYLLHNNTYDNINEIIDNYEFILMIRIDFYIKKYFFNILEFDCHKIKFAHIDTNQVYIDINNIEFNKDDIKSKSYLVCHNIILYPKKFFFTIKNKYVYNQTHHIRDSLIHNGIDINDIDYFVYTLHVSNTALGWNPLYIQVGRYYNNTINKNNLSCSFVEYNYCKLNDIFKHDIIKTITNYEQYLNTDTLEEQLLSLNNKLLF